MEDDIGYIGGLLTPRENLIPNIQSAYGAIIQNAPDYQYFTAPLSNQGRSTASYGTQNQLVVAPDTGVRLVNNATGEVVFSGSGYEGAQQAIDAANALSSSSGKKANWDIQVTRPGSTQFESVSTERPDVSGLGIAADLALPTIGAILAGPLGAAAGSGVSSVAQGRSIEDALLRAAIAGGSTYLGGQLFGPASTTTNAAINADLIPNALSGLNFGSIASTAIPAGVGGAVGAAIPTFGSDIIVNALGQVVPNLAGAAGSLATNLVPNFFDSAQFNNMTSPSSTSTTGDQTTDLTVTARIPPATTTTPSVPVPVPGGTNVPPPNPLEDIKVTAPKDTKVITPPVIPPVFQPGTTTSPTDTATTKKDDGVLGTDLNLAQLASITGIGVDLLGKLIGGGGGAGTTTTTPYVSPFGGDVGIGPLASRTQVNPNIADYERYGFGPEALFFSGGQSGVAPTYNPTSQTTTTTAPPTTSTPNNTITKPVLNPGGTPTGPALTTPTLLPNMVSSLGPNATSGEIEAALANATTAAEATKLNPGTVYFNIDQSTADALGDRGLIGDVMSIQQLQQAMAARELTDPNKYATNLYNQIGQQLSGGLLNIDQARAIQNQIQQQLVSSPNVTTQSLQSIYDTNMQKYKPLI